MKKLLLSSLLICSSLQAVEVADIHEWSKFALLATEKQFDIVQKINGDNDHLTYYLLGLMDAYYDIYQMTEE